MFFSESSLLLSSVNTNTTMRTCLLALVALSSFIVCWLGVGHFKRFRKAGCNPIFSNPLHCANPLLPTIGQNLVH
jgi:hypothetical protein